MDNFSPYYNKLLLNGLIPLIRLAFPAAFSLLHLADPPQPTGGRVELQHCNKEIHGIAYENVNLSIALKQPQNSTSHRQFPP